MRLVAIRIALLFLFAAAAAWIVSAVTVAEFSLALTPQISSLYFIPVNLIGLWLLVRHGRRSGLILAAMMDFDRRRLGRDILLGLLWLFVLFLPFAVAINLVMLVMFGPSGMFAGFETVFTPAPGQVLTLAPWFQWTSAILIAVLFPLTNAPVEELTYRGHAQTRLLERDFAPWLAILVSALAFGLQHILLAPTGAGMLVYFTAFTVWGAGAGIIYLKSGRLMPLILAHLLVNLMTAAVPLVLLAVGL